MHVFDTIASCLLLAGGIWSYSRGLTREVISLLGLMSAFVVSAWGYPYVARVLTPVTSATWPHNTIGIGIIFIVIILSYLMIAGQASRMIKAVGLSLPDRVLGGLFGVIKLGVIIAIGLLITTRFYPTMTTQVTAGSVLAPYLFQTSDFIATLLPRDLQTDFNRDYQRRGDSLKPMQYRPPSHSKSNQSSISTPQAFTLDPKGNPEAISSHISPHDEQALRRLIRERLINP